MADCAPSFFAGLLPHNASINYAVHVPQGGSFGDGNPAFPSNATQLPSLCAISVHVNSSVSSSFDFALFLPEKQDWNGRFFTTGNGGLSGGINFGTMGLFSQYGSAAMSTDTGHLSDSSDGRWALHAPQSVIDWGYRALHESVLLSKTILPAYYGKSPHHSYYAACSTGGRQGLVEAQRFPTDFDGIAIGAPAWDFNHLPEVTVQFGKVNLPKTSDHHIPAPMLDIIASEMIRQCDPQDGVVDGIVQNPFACQFDPLTLLCTPGSNSTTCLSGRQFDTLRQLYSKYFDTNQTFVYPGLALGASAAQLAGGSAPADIGLSWLQNAIHQQADWPWQDYDYSTVQLAEKFNPGNASLTDFDLSAFKARGGKIIVYHGLADPLIPSGSSIQLYESIAKTMRPKGASLDDFYKFYTIPGMGHCARNGHGADKAPWYIAGAYQNSIEGVTHSVPGFQDAQHDVLLAIQKWVEASDAPDHLIATKFHNDSATDGIERQRPLCPYPKQARYNGTGPVDDAGSWDCKTLY